MTKLKTTLKLPPADEYQRAILNPGVCFADAELKHGQPHTNNWGLPLPWSGQFACVFRLKTKAGLRAVRCFTSQVTDQQDRYAALHDHVSGSAAPMLADFEYQPQGVLVKGEWYPIVKMEWIAGETLDRVVERYCANKDAQALSGLAKQWMKVVDGLQRRQIAHGDLQHDNILVNNGSIQLVDYDGIYVPGLHHLSGLELGHPHYQHPGRKLSDYGPGIDNFPALVIYLSLIALAGDSTLWDRFHQDKHLILRNEDYRLRSESPLFLELTKSRSPEVVRLSLELLKACSAPAAAAPALTVLTTGLAPVRNAEWIRSWLGVEVNRAPSLAGALAVATVGAQQSAAPPPITVSPTMKLPASNLTVVTPRMPDTTLLRTWMDNKVDATVDWLTRIPSASQLSPGLSLIVLLAVGVGGGVLASYLSAIGAPEFVQALLYSAALPFAFVTARRLGLALLAYVVLINVQALLPMEWNFAYLWYALIPGALTAGILRRAQGNEIRLRTVFQALMVGALVRFPVSIVALGRSPGWNDLILSLLAAAVATVAATVLARGARTLIQALK
jgi:hypothetical protein